MRPKVLLAAMIAVAAMAAAPAAHAQSIELTVLSSRADQVSGGDALIRVDAPRGLLQKLRVKRNGTDVTGAFHREGRHLVGLVDGLRLGRN